MEHEPAERAFHDPSAWQDSEAGMVRVAAYDFHVDTQVGTVVYDFGVVAAVYPRLRDGGRAHGEAVEYLPTYG